MNLNYVLAERTNGANPFKIFEALADMDGSAIAFAISRMDYSQFLKTAYWFGVSQTAKARAGMRCQVCNSAAGINVHHRTYDFHGREHTHMNDLVVLCSNCHGLFHGHRSASLPSEENSVERVRKSKRLNRRGIVEVPYSEEDVKIPDGERFVLTRELIDNCRANGSFTYATLNALGVTKEKMTHGWIDRLVGTALSRQQYSAAVRAKFRYREKLKHGD